jgi:hypothetical protein
VLVNVNAPSVDVEGCVLINVTSTRPIKGRGGLLYNVVDEAGGVEPLTCDAVRDDVFDNPKPNPTLPLTLPLTPIRTLTLPLTPFL